jgi:hypothetical protein
LGPIWAGFARAPFIWDPRAHDVATKIATELKGNRNDLEVPLLFATYNGLDFGPILADFWRFLGPLLTLSLTFGLVEEASSRTRPSFGQAG